jgi:hypothetical protein
MEGGNCCVLFYCYEGIFYTTGPQENNPMCCQPVISSHPLYTSSFPSGYLIQPPLPHTLEDVARQVFDLQLQNFDPDNEDNGLHNAISSEQSQIRGEAR